jgi:hypothetical protein
MTDIPELQHLLIEASARRSRRRRLRAAGTRFAALAAAVVVAVVVYLRSEVADVEIPAASPRASAIPHVPPRTVEQAYAVFRRPVTAADEAKLAVQPGLEDPETRRIAQTPSNDVYLAHKGWGMCLMIESRRGRPGGSSCGRAADYLDAIIPIGVASPDQGPSTIAFAFPDGVRKVTLTLENGDISTYAVTTNGFARDVAARPVRLAWTAPNGTAQSVDFSSGHPFRSSAPLRG